MKLYDILTHADFKFSKKGVEVICEKIRVKGEIDDVVDFALKRENNYRNIDERDLMIITMSGERVYHQRMGEVILDERINE